MPLLTIITRTFNRRPSGLARCAASVASQTLAGEVEHLYVVDEVGRGVGWSYANLKNVTPSGDYVMLLDDDDYLVDVDFVRDFRRTVAKAPEVVIVKMDVNGRILPPDTQGEPQLGFIACSCFIVRRDIWNEHVGDFTETYDADYQFIHKVWEHGHPFVKWNRLVSKVGQVSSGKPE